MTRFSVERLAFSAEQIQLWARTDPRHTNWPVVYVIDGDRRGAGPDSIYVGETRNAAARMRQHLASPQERGLRSIRVVVDDTYNKSVCLDLESHLIRWLAGDGRYAVLNGNEGIIDAAYYDREAYRESFREIFEQLRAEGLFERSIPQIENSDLFKLSPFKALTRDQAIAVEALLDDLLSDLDHTKSNVRTSVVQGHPGTGKTIVAIFLMKLLADIRDYADEDEIDPDSLFSEYFVPENRERLAGFRMALVVPQQSLRLSIRKVFRKTPKLHPSMVLSPFDIGKSPERFDLLIVDETHRLNRRANQPTGVLNKAFGDINRTLFGADDPTFTQLDWITAQSANQIFLLDEAQSVRPADLPMSRLRTLVGDARAEHRHYVLASQMRVRAGTDYVDFLRAVLAPVPQPVERPDFGEYDLQFFDDLGAMQSAIRERDQEHGLARLVAGYAWDWKSRKDPEAYDIELDGLSLRWNSTDKDWINSPGSLDEVGSIHTVQGYDLNYAGVIIGAELGFDAAAGVITFDRDAYRDKKGKESNGTPKHVYTDAELLQFVLNIYRVLLSRGIRGTYVYVCDPSLREYLRRWFA